MATQEPQTSPSQSVPEESTKQTEEDPILKKGGIDRLRLLLLYAFSAERLREDDIEELRSTLSTVYPDLKLDSLLHSKPKSMTTFVETEETKSGISGIFSSNFE